MFSSAFFMLAHMQRPHGYHTELAEDFSMAFPHSSIFAPAVTIRATHAFLSIKLNRFRLS